MYYVQNSIDVGVQLPRAVYSNSVRHDHCVYPHVRVLYIRHDASVKDSEQSVGRIYTWQHSEVSPKLFLSNYSRQSSVCRWLDETPTARMIARCTQDINAVDNPIPRQFSALTETGMSVITKFGVITIFTPIFFAPGLAMAGLCMYLGSIYLKAQLSVKREMR